MRKVVIIGGGVTGLSAAHAIQEARNNGEEVDYLLVERDNRLGGKIFTEKVDGYTVEAGPDCFISHKPQVIQMADKLDFSEELLGANEAVKRTYVLSGGRLHQLPEGMLIMIPSKIIPFALSPLISWPGKARMLLDLVIPKKKDDKEETVTEFVTRRLGKEALDKIAEPLIAGIHAGDPDTMSINGMQMMLKMEQDHGSLIKAMLAARKRPPGAPKDWKKGQASYVGKAKVKQTFFMTFKEGTQYLTDRLAATCNPEKLVTGKNVTKLEKRPQGGYTVTIEGMEPVAADAVIVATLADTAAKLMKDIDRDAHEMLASIPHIDSATVSLGYKKSDIEGKVDGFGFVVPQKEKRKIMAATYSSIKWDFRTPDEDHVLIRAFVGGAKNQHLVRMDDDEMLKIVLGELKDVLKLDAEPDLVKIYRWFDGMPQYNVGHRAKVAKIMEKVSAHDGLQLCGGAYHGVGIPDCCKGGLTAGEKAVDFLKTLEPVSQTI
ncbi:MAG: protoporphyrinogen oxidase [Candidatus Aquicultorales bacterium]